MLWCGWLGTTGGGLCWLVPLVGLVFMGLMFFFCFRRFGRMGGCRRASGELSGLEREVQGLKEDVRKL